MTKKAKNQDGDFEALLMEATRTVEQELSIEDQGWIKLGLAGDVVPAADRKAYLQQSRIYYTKDPLARQAIRLWTDYTFGSGMTWAAEEDRTQKVLEAFWGNPDNEAVLSPRGQRRSSDKLLVDGEVFLAVFLSGEKSTIRLIDPLEITEIISDPDDKEDVRYFKREWTNLQGAGKVAYYPSFRNLKNKGCKDSSGNNVKAEAGTPLVYHLPYNTIGQRGNPLLLPAMDWIKQHRRFLASRVAIMLAKARFAWKDKVKGNAATVESIKAQFQDAEVPAGSVAVENMGSELTPITAPTGSAEAYQDGRMLKLMICAAVGIPEQYFGDIATGNLATAKTVELPMLKMFQSYQEVWQGTYKAIDELVLADAGVKPDKWYVDRDFPAIAPEDAMAVAQAIVYITQAMPELAYAKEVQMLALSSLGINDVEEVLKGITESTDVSLKLAKAVKEFKDKGIAELTALKFYEGGD